MIKTVITAVLFTFAVAPVATAQERAVHGATVVTSMERQSAADTRWDALVRGNREFAAGRVDYRQLIPDRERLRMSQDPRVTVLGCSDSRVPPELVFNQSLGSLFVIRTAGNVADQFGIASIEYAVASGFTDLIVVLGHESCGAVKAALDHGDPGTPALRELVERIRMSFVGFEWNSKDKGNTDRAIEMNARSAAAGLVAGSEVIRSAAAKGTLEVVPAYYDFRSGEVRRLD